MPKSTTNSLSSTQIKIHQQSKNIQQADNLLSLGKVLAKKGEWKEAIAAYRKAIEAYYTCLQNYQYLGDVLVEIGEALEQLQKWGENFKLDQELGLKPEKIGDSQGEITSYQKVITQDPPIILFTPYYKAKRHKRQNELIYCLRRNIQCNEIEKIVLIIDDDHIPELKSPKIEIVKIAARPTYLDWVELTQKKCQNKISILANSDIYFDESITRFREIFAANKQAFVALSRYEKEGYNQKMHKNPHWSQDVWAVSGEYNFTESFKNYLRIPLGVPRCDNKIAYLFAIHGFQVYNPCNHIKTVHVQESQLRDYDKYSDTTVLGGTAWVYPSIVIDEPSKLQIDLWTLNSSDLTGLQINKTWELAHKSKQTEPEKISEVSVEEKIEKQKSLINIVGFDSDWQYPVITEKYAYQMAHKFLIIDNFHKNVVYFGFPWATLIDKLVHSSDQTEANTLKKKLLGFASELKNYKRVITVCQHIRMLEFESIFYEVGITDIFWSHTIKDQNFLPSYPNILLHPFPLYPVQAINLEETETEKKYLFSFVGTRPNKSYLTDSRNNILDYLSSDDRGLVIARDKWHYNKIVYEHQVLKQVKKNKALVDQSASAEFKQVMKQSVFALCPSGSGPNSIRLWEAIGFGVIPVVLADTYLPPGDLKLWNDAIVTCSETLEEIKALPERLAKMQKDDQLLKIKHHALKQLWNRYGVDCFVYDIVKLFFKYASGDIAVTNVSTTTANNSKKTAKRLPRNKIYNPNRRSTTKKNNNRYSR